MRFEIVVDDYSEIVIGLLTGLAQHINTYLINSVEVKKQVSRSKAKVKEK